MGLFSFLFRFVLLFFSSVLVAHVLIQHLAPPQPPGTMSSPVNTHGHTYHVVCFGTEKLSSSSSEDVIVFHHGNLVNTVTYLPLQQQLWHHHQVPSCSVDRLGMGWSLAPNAWNFSLADEADGIETALNQVINSSSSSPSFIHAGHSGGGPIAFLLASRHRNGLLLYDAVTTASFQCHDFVATMNYFGSVLNGNFFFFLQKSGLRRAISWLSVDASVPLAPKTEHKSLFVSSVLQDSVFSSEIAHFFRTESNAKTATAIASHSIRGVKTVILKADPSEIDMSCSNEKSATFLSQLGCDTFQINQNGYHHMNQIEDVQSTLQALKFLKKKMKKGTLSREFDESVVEIEVVEEPITSRVPTQLSLSSFVKSPGAYFEKWIGEQQVICGGPPWSVTATLPRVITGFLGAFIGLACLGLIDQYALSQYKIRAILASFGATSVLVFGAPESPLAQPRNVFFGSTFSALIGLFCRNISLVRPDLMWLSGSLATSLAIAVMIVTNTVHPPAGATAFICATSTDPFLVSQGYLVVVTPVMLGCLILLSVAVIIDNFFLNFPRYWI